MVVKLKFKYVPFFLSYVVVFVKGLELFTFIKEYIISLEYTRHIGQVCKVSIDLLTLAGLSTNISVDRPADPGRCTVKLQTCGP